MDVKSVPTTFCGVPIRRAHINYDNVILLHYPSHVHNIIVAKPSSILQATRVYDEYRPNLEEPM